MPGPIESMDNINAFESCEDVQEAWGCNSNGDDLHDHWESANGSLQDAVLEKSSCTKYEYKMASTYSNGVVEQVEVEQTEEEVGGEVLVEERRKMTTRVEESMDYDSTVEDVEDVVEAQMCLDVSGALNRRKILSMQHGKTFSYADKDDDNEDPTRRPQVSPQVSPLARGIKIVRNPSYQAAMRGPPTLAPFCAPSPPPSPPSRSLTPDRQSSSYEPSPDREASPATVRGKSPSLTINNNVITLDTANNNGVLTKDAIAVAAAALEGLEVLEGRGGWGGANIGRSASFGGSHATSVERLSAGSLSQGNSRNGSSEPLPSEPNQAPRDENSPRTPIRGSAITRSFRKLFNTPVRRSPTAPTLTTTAPPEDYWPDVIDDESSSPPRPSSRLRRLSSTLTRRLSNRSPKMANHGQHPSHNGSIPLDDCKHLVEYEALIKLFTCCGCAANLLPPLAQCRKGHLVCSSCRTSLKHQCPICRQRFADNTNVMMEQVCQLIRFPCRFAIQGCPEYHLLKNKVDHEHFCSFRPVHCHHGPQGCPKILRLRDMHQHHDECEYRAKLK